MVQAISLALQESRTCVPLISIWPQHNVPDIAPVVLPCLQSHPGLIVNSIPSIATRLGSNSFIADSSFVHQGRSRSPRSHSVRVSVCLSVCPAQALNLHLSFIGLSRICLRSVSGKSWVSLRSVSGQSQVSLRSVSGLSQVSL